MNKKIILILLLLQIPNVNAQVIAECDGVEGYTFNHSTELSVLTKTKNLDKFVPDRIKNKISLIKSGNDYDILTSSDFSARSGGGKIQQLYHSETSISFIVSYPPFTIEIYDFWIDGKGKAQLDFIQNRSGYALYPKSTLLTGNCDFIKFDLINSQ